jgi:hypothetical protein
MEERPKEQPQIGEQVRYGKPGPVLLTIERVGVYQFPQDAWNVVAGGIPMLVRRDGEDGIPWQRLT